MTGNYKKYGHDSDYVQSDNSLIIRFFVCESGVVICCGINRCGLFAYDGSEQVIPFRGDDLG